MTLHRIYRRQTLAMTPAQAWDFLSSPRFLNDITPDFFHVRIDSPVPDELYAGLLICYRMRAVLGVSMTWVSDISHCDRPHRFVYRQPVGPFKFWSHEVCIKPCEHGIVLEDIVYYSMPFGWIGNLLNKLFIGRRLQQIFTHRARWLHNKWGVHE